MPPGIPQANFAGIPGALAFGAAGGNLPGQFPGALPASGSFINPTAAAAASQRGAAGPNVAALPPPGPPPANRNAALAAAISQSGQTQFGNAGQAIPPNLPLNLLGRTGPNNLFDAFLSGQGTAQGSQLAGNGQTLSAIAQQADPNAQSQLAANSATGGSQLQGNGATSETAGAGGLLTDEMIDQLVADNPFLNREVLQQILADNTESGRLFVQQLLAGRGIDTGGGSDQGSFGDGSGTFNTGLDGSAATDPLGPQGGSALLEAFRQGSPGLPGSPIAGAGGLLATAGPFASGDGKNPLFGSLEGGSHVDETLGAALNQAVNESGLQQGRSDEALDQLRNLAARLQGSPAQITGDRAATAAGLRTQEGSLDELLAGLQGDLDTSSAASRNASINSARDLGLLGQGGASSAALGGINNRENALRQQGQFDITRMMEQLTNDRIGQASQVAPRSAQVTQALTQNPVLDIVRTLQGPRNPAQIDVINFLKNIANLQSGTALANQGPSGFELAGQLGGSLIGSLGDIISAKI